MKNIRLLFELVLILLVSNPAEMRPTGSSNVQIDAFVEQQMARDHLPGLALVITKGDRVFYLKGYGKASNQAPITPQTQFYLASVSKSFTALAVMQLVEAGRIDLDAPIHSYLPAFTTKDSQAAGQVTVRHLLNQTSGLADQGFPEMRLPQMKSAAERLTSLRSARPAGPPGQEFHYFNPNYEVLARLVEVASGQSFSAYLQNRIFTPLGMKNTFNVMRSDETKEKAIHLAQGHLLPYGIPFGVEEMTGYVGGSGGVISTAEDLANFLIMQNQQGRLGDQMIVSPESIARMHSPPSGIKTNYGMGWFERQENGQLILEHNGILSAFYAEVVLLPEEQIGIGLLYNASSFPATAFAFPQIKNGLVTLLTGRTPQTRGFTLTHWGILLGLLTLIGASLALYSMIHLPNWARWAESRPTWQLVPGILWALAPSFLLIGVPWIVSASSGRVFGYAALLRSLPELFLWIGICAVLGLVNGIYRIRWILP